MKSWNMVGALHSLNGITRYYQCLVGWMKAVFHSSTSQMHTRFWPLCRSSLMKMVAWKREQKTAEEEVAEVDCSALRN